MWADLTYAESYFTGRLNTDEWDDAGDATKTKALTMAYNQILIMEYDFPETATTNMKNAQCEQALFLLKFGDGAERREALQAQGVKSAGIIQETYESKSGISIAPLAARMLLDYDDPDYAPIAGGELERDDDE